MICKAGDVELVEREGGFAGTMLVWGQHGQLVKFRMRKGAYAPMHTHEHFEQCGYILSGRAVAGWCPRAFRTTAARSRTPKVSR
jgi:hypothetical protein